MLGISKSEKNIILGFLIFGLFYTGLFYYKKISLRPRVVAIDVDNIRTLININTATMKDLESLPGIGTFLAEKIISYREKSDGFQRKEELKNINGIGNKKFEKIKDYISISE